MKLNAEDEQRLAAYTAAGAITREVLDGRTADKDWALTFALLQTPECVVSDPWIAHGIRQGMVRLGQPNVTEEDISHLELSQEVLDEMVQTATFPVSRNRFNKDLVIMMPDTSLPPLLASLLSPSPILCVGTPMELSLLSDQFTRMELCPSNA